MSENESKQEPTAESLFKELNVKNMSEAMDMIKLIEPIIVNSVKLERWFEATPISIQCKNSKDTMRANAILAALSVSVNDYIEKTKKFNQPEYIEPTIITEEEAKKMLSSNETDNEED